MLLFALLAFAFDAPEPPLVAPTEAKSPQEQQKLFRLPPGFKIELVASEPAFRKPMNMAFDRYGRLLFTESAEYPYPAADPAKARDTVMALVDADGDGLPKRPVKLLAGLNIPIGLCPLPDGALVFDIPRIRRWQGKDALAHPQPLGGEIGRRDTHGMTSSFTRGLDGWIYACHGYANESTLRGTDGSAITMSSGNTYRFRPDGSRVEQWTWGQVNPFGLCFDEFGNLFSADCHTRPGMQLLRGGRYDSFGKPHDGLGYAPEMMAHAHGSTGICGALVYLAPNFPAPYRGRLFLCNPVTGRINSDTLETRGSTVVAKEEPDFLSCDDPWFRPVDIKLAPDGSVYIADFYNCIIGHYEVPLNHPRRDRTRGRIWRIAYVGENAARHAPLGDLTGLTLARLVELMGDPNIAVRYLATHECVDRFGASCAAPLAARLAGIPRAEDANFRAHALWALERVGKLDAALAARFAVDPDPVPRTHLLRLLADRKEWSAAERQIALSGLNDAHGMARRAAADAVGRHPAAEQTALLVAQVRAADPADAALVHTLRMALRDHLAAFPPAWPESADPADRQRLADACLGTPEPRAARYAFRLLQQTAGQWRAEEILRHAARRLAAEELIEPAKWLAAQTGRVDAVPLGKWALAAQEGYAARGVKTPAPLAEVELHAANKLIDDPDPGRRKQGLEYARKFRLGTLARRCAALIGATDQDFEVRGAALEALGALDPPGFVAAAGKLLLAPNENRHLRRHAANVLLGSPDGAAARSACAAALPTAPADLAAPLARCLARGPEGAAELAKLLAAGKAPKAVLAEAGVADGLRQHGGPALGPQLDAWLKEIPPEDETLRKLLDRRREDIWSGKIDPVRGKEVFAKNCANCHQVGGVGSKIGPQLDGIGVRGLERLLEDTLAPSRNVDQAFRASVLQLEDGRTFTGLVQREEGEQLVCADAQGKEQRFARKEVVRRKITALSPMPNDVAAKLPAAEFRDLMGYLLTQRNK